MTATVIPFEPSLTTADIARLTELTGQLSANGWVSAAEVGETNPLYLNRVFAARSRFGECIAPPMLTFCLCFSELLDALLSTPLPSGDFAALARSSRASGSSTLTGRGFSRAPRRSHASSVTPASS